MRYIPIAKFCDDYGLSEETIRGYIKQGAWLKGKEYFQPMGIRGTILIDLNGYSHWKKHCEKRLKNKAKYRPCQLYRHFDSNDVLLYVGISISFMSRLGQHKSTAKWFKEITTVKVEHFPNVYEAEAAEIHAIRAESPKHNIEHARLM